jgi:hypothetical protein
MSDERKERGADSCPSPCSATHRFTDTPLRDDVWRVKCTGCGDSVETDDYGARVGFKERHMACSPNDPAHRSAPGVTVERERNYAKANND